MHVPVRVPFLVCLLRNEIEVLKQHAPPKKRGFHCFQLEESKVVPPAAKVLAYLIARYQAGLDLKTEGKGLVSLRIQKGASCKEELRLLVAKFGLPVVAFVQQTANDGDNVGSLHRRFSPKVRVLCMYQVGAQLIKVMASIANDCK